MRAASTRWIEAMARTKPMAAIIGVGESAIGRVPGRTALDLMEEAASRALASAGLTRDAIDGIISLPCATESWIMPAAVVARGLGLDPGYISTVDVTGAGGAAMIDQAARVVATGGAEAILVVAGQPLLSGFSRDRAVARMAQSAAHVAAEVPAGVPVPGLYALLATRHMHLYGTTREQIATVAVETRRHAGNNPNAHFQKPITVDDVLASKPISSPFTLLDCAPVSDGAAAMIVVSAERARTLKARAAYLLGSGYGLSHAYLSDADDPMATGARRSGATAFARSGLQPGDMDFAELYDCFTITLMIELEDLGFCRHGESGAFVASGALGREGSLPTNTGGGLLSGGHPGYPAGMFPVVEAARQIMGEAGARQLPKNNLAMAHGNGGVIGMHCSLVLGSADV
jgi:acetyl-CoA acetyltransferase